MTDFNKNSLLRLHQILGRGNQGGLIPISKSTWWKWIQEDQRAPKPIKIGRCTFWFAKEVYAYIEAHKSNNNTKEVTCSESK